MRISAKADYAVRAAVEMAAAGDEPVKGEKIAEAQDIPLQFLEHILLELKHHGIVRARRGAKGGYWLARPAEEVTIADVVRAVEGPIANVQSQPPEAIEYSGSAEHQSSSGTVTQSVDLAPTSVALTSSIDPSVTGQPVTFSATVTVPAPGAGPATGTVSFFRAGGALLDTVALDASGRADLVSSLLGSGTGSPSRPPSSASATFASGPGS